MRIEDNKTVMKKYGKLLEEERKKQTEYKDMSAIDRLLKGTPEQRAWDRLTATYK